jgi:uncharacterized membrane protein HdeD (DUF308 family)
MSPRDWLRLIGGILIAAGLIVFAASATGNVYAFLVGLFLVPLGAIIFFSNNNREAQRNIMRVYWTFLRWLRDMRSQ